MAVVHLKSNSLAKRDENPIQFDTPQSNGLLHEKVGTVATTAGDSIGSTYRLVSIPSTARVSQVLLYSTDMGTAGDADVGLYKTPADGGDVVDADFFASAVDINAAALNAVDVTHESGVFGLDKADLPIWKVLGLAADPQCMYDVVATLTEASEDAGTIVAKVKYSY